MGQYFHHKFATHSKFIFISCLEVAIPSPQYDVICFSFITVHYHVHSRIGSCSWIFICSDPDTPFALWRQEEKKTRIENFSMLLYSLDIPTLPKCPVTRKFVCCGDQNRPGHPVFNPFPHQPHPLPHSAMPLENKTVDMQLIYILRTHNLMVQCQNEGRTTVINFVTKEVDIDKTSEKD